VLINQVESRTGFALYGVAFRNAIEELGKRTELAPVQLLLNYESVLFNGVKDLRQVNFVLNSMLV